MTANETIDKLTETFNALENAVTAFPEGKFAQRPSDGKWSVAENVEHLFLTVKPLVGLFGKKDFMEATWGRHTGASMSYDEVLEAYLQKLRITTITTNPFAPQTLLSREELLENLHSINQKFIERATAMSEDELDSYQIPHPLLGLLSCREFLHFTRYHTLHHLKAIEQR
jgi:hypothetical protein